MIVAVVLAGWLCLSVGLGLLLAPCLSRQPLAAAVRPEARQLVGPGAPERRAA